MIESGPNILRLFALPLFAWAAWYDYNIRRVDKNLWPKLIAIGAIASMWQVLQIAPIHTVEEFNTLRQILLTAGVFSVSSAFLYNIGSLGGADAKAIFTIGILFPTSFTLGIPFTETTVPLFPNPMGVTAVTVIINGFVFSTMYLIIMWHRNISRGERSHSLLTSEYRYRDELEQVAGDLKGEDENGMPFLLDLDALRMYLRWRGIDIAQLVQGKDELRDPSSITTTYEVDDGVIYVEDGSGYFKNLKKFGEKKQREIDEEGPEITADDEWGAEKFLNSIDHSAYGTTAEELRNGLDLITDQKSLRVIPGFPFLIPIFLSLLVTLTLGDITVSWVILILS